MKQRAGIVTALGMLLFVVVGARTAHAASLTVTTSNDELTPNGQCSLREAIRNANADSRLHPDCVEVGAYGADTVVMQSGINPTLTITGAGEDAAATGDLDLTGVLTVQGAGLGPGFGFLTLISGQALQDRIFHVRPGAVVTITNLFFNNGDAGTGAGGSLLNEGQVTLTNVGSNGNRAGSGGYVLQNNGVMTLNRTRIAISDGPNVGANIVSAGTLIVSNSTIDNAGGTAPIAHGIRIEGGNATLTNVTLARNAGIGGTPAGGGLFASSGAGTIILNNVTIADSVDGIERQGGTVRVRNTLIASNRGRNCIGTVISDGFNLSDDANCTSFTQTGDLPANTDAKLGALSNTASLTNAHPLPLGSPAIDAGNLATPLDGNGGRCAATDERGVPRPQDGDGASGARCDIGAYELVRLVVNATDDDVDATPGDAGCATAAPARCTLRAAVQEANALGTASIVLPASATPYTLTRAGDDTTAVPGDLDINGEVTIVGGASASTIIDGGGIDRVFELRSGILDLADVTVRNGNATGNRFLGDGGGIRVSSGGGGDLRLTRVTLANNRTARNGGGLAFDEGGNLEILDSTIRDNTATGTGGGIWLSEGANLDIVGSTISGNQANSGGGLSVDDSEPGLINVTISGNHAATEGGGVLVGGFFGGAVDIASTTIANNQAATGGGLRALDPSSPSGTSLISVRDSIVANNTPENCTPAHIRSDGFNLSNTTACGFTQATDIQNADPKLGPLADNGGPTFTHALLPGSPAIDTADPATPFGPSPDSSGVSIAAAGAPCRTADQRGRPRPIDGNGDGISRCDIGAFEVVPCAPRPNVGVLVRPAGVGTLQVTIFAQTNPATSTNSLRQLRFGTASNALIDVPGGPTNSGGNTTVTVPNGTSQTTFTLRRQGGGAFSVPLTVVDGCGDWPTFAGGGARVP